MIIYLDMDGVIANIHKEIGIHTKPADNPQEILEPGFFEKLEVMPGAEDFIHWAQARPDIQLWIATKIPSKNPGAASEKLNWVKKHFPILSKRVFITPDKTKLLGDFLIDDDPRWKDFEGEFFLFDPINPKTSFRKAITAIEHKLPNTQKLSLHYTSLGQLKITNESHTEISKLVLKEGMRVFEKIAAGTSVVVSKPQSFEGNALSVEVESIEWRDGAQASDILLRTYHD